MSTTKRTLLSDGVTDIVVELSEEEIERMQTDEEYCQEVFTKHSSVESPPAQVWRVDGRLDFRKNKKQYIVTEEELRRRKLEKFSTSTYITYLRRSHTNGKESLPDVCKDGVKKNQLTEFSSYTALVEGEIQDMGEDLKTIISSTDVRKLLLRGVDFDGVYREQINKISQNAITLIPGSEADQRTHGFLGIVLPFIIEILKE